MKSDNLELIDLSVARDGITMLPPITQRLRAGEILLVHGRNGCGKSSLLKSIAGLLTPASGQILLGGAALHKHPLYPRNITYIGHKRGVEPSMSVRAHVAFWARAFGQRELIEVALHYFDLTDIADTPVERLSAGWQQRVALTRLIVQPGSLWLLDEPTANLDEDGLRLLTAIIETRQERGGMVIIASHAPFDGEQLQRLDLNTLSGHGGRHVSGAH